MSVRNPGGATERLLKSLEPSNRMASVSEGDGCPRVSFVNAPNLCLLNYYTATRRQETPSVGSNYDGSYGVDSQDIMNIPNIGFSSFTLFPDQQSYSPPDPYLDAYTNTLNSGIDWILKQAQSAAA